MCFEQELLSPEFHVAAPGQPQLQHPVCICAGTAELLHQAAKTASGNPASNGDSHALTPSHFVTETDQPGTSRQHISDHQPAHPTHNPAKAQEHAAGSVDHPARSMDQLAGSAKQATMEAVLEIYEEPDAYAGLYNYAKALEDVEAGLLAGFFFKHYCLASNVIGSQSKGTESWTP